MPVPNYVTGVGESGDLIQEPEFQSLPVTPFTGLPPMAPTTQAPMVPGVGPRPQPQPPPSKLGELLKVILPAVTGVMAARQGGPGAAAALLKSYSGELSAQREQAEARHKLDVIEARDQLERDTKATQYRTEQAQKLATFENAIAKQLAAMDDPNEYAEVLRHADEASATAYGTPIGYFTSRYALTPSAKETKQAKAALTSLPKAIQDGLESGQLDATQVRLSSGPMSGKTVREVQTLAGAASVQTATGGPVTLPAGAGREDESAFIQRAIQTRQKQLGRPLTEAEMNDEAVKARRQWLAPTPDASRTEMNEMRSQLLELQVRQLQQQMDAGQLTPAQFNQASALAQDFNTQVKDFLTKRGAYQTIIATVQDPSAAGDLSLIFAFMKMLDPTSVVRENEQASAQNAAGVPERVRNVWNRALTGERLSPSQRADFVRQAANQYGAAKRGFLDLKSIYDQRALKQRLPAGMVTFDLPDPGADRPETAPSAAPKEGDTKPITLEDGTTGTAEYKKNAQGVLTWIRVK